MPNILLQVLSNADIDWLVTTGQRQHLKDGEVLMSPGQSLSELYVLLEGRLVVQTSGDHGEDPGEFAQLSRGDLVGEGWLFDNEPVALVRAAGAAIALSIPKNKLTRKLQQDLSFAAHFYRAIALTASEQIRLLFENSELLRYQSGQMVKEALFVFGELQDSDLDWMVSAGSVEKLKAGKVLLNARRPVDALYTLLDGQLAIATTENPCDPFSTCSNGLEKLGASQNFSAIAYLSRGGLPGIISFLDFQPLPVRISAVKESLLLAIPRQKVSIKLQEDLGFAARFYRVIATQAANLLNTVMAASGDPGGVADMKIDDELDIEALQRISQGGAKFDWMLNHLGISTTGASV